MDDDRGPLRWNLKTKLLVLTALLTVCSVFVVSLLSYMRYTRDFEKQSSDKVQQIIELASLNINTYLDDLFRLSLAPYRNNTLMQAVEDNSNKTEIGQLEKRRLVEGFLDEMMIYPRQDIIQVFILTDEIYTSGRNPRSVDPNADFRHLDWYRKALQNQTPFFVPTQTQDLAGPGAPQVFSIVRQLRSTTNTEQVLGVIKVDANYKGVADIGSRIRMGKDGGLFIIDNNKNLIYSSLTELNPADIYERIVEQNKPNAPFLTEHNGYLVNSAYLPAAGWTIVAVNSVKELNANAAQTRNYAFFLAIVCSLLAISMISLLTGRFLKPLFNVVELMHQVQGGRLDVRFDERRSDEIGYLGSSFNSLVSQIGVMLEENTRLVKEVYESKLLQKEAQITALYNQIRPHFIFNTLNMISMLMQTGDEAKAVDHINKLSSLLRSMFSWDKTITLQREVDLLHAYLGIQSSRYQGRLDYRIDIPPELNDIVIPALLLQPVVENAVIHGCENKRDKTVIVITGRIQGDTLNLEVEDTGPGMDAETLARLRERLEAGSIDAGRQPGAADGVSGEAGHAGKREEARGAPGGDERHADAPDGGNTGEAAAGQDRGLSEGSPADHAEAGVGKQRSGIGLVNVNQRIKWNYGPEYGLVIDSIPGQGTRAILRIPANSQA